MDELGEVDCGDEGAGESCCDDEMLGGELRLLWLLGGDAMLGGCSRCGCTEGCCVV